MRSPILLLSVLLTSFVSGSTIPPPDADGKYTLVAEGIRAQFIPYGASITNLFVVDVNGTERDIVAGYDNATYYSEDPIHPHFGGVPGRYANRIANATFSIGNGTFHTDANENGNTLHGGSDGWDYRNFTVTTLTNSSITFTLLDPAGSMGFPGDVSATITYSLTPHTWHLGMSASALTAATPLMLSSHVYWNLDGFANPTDATARAHSLQIPRGGLRTAVDSALIPTGDLLANPVGTMYDFWSAPKALGRDLGAEGFYDTCFVLTGEPDLEEEAAPVVTLDSPWSGIRLDVFSQQPAVQIFSCDGMRAKNITLKSTQGVAGREPFIQDTGCLVIEVEDWIDGINQPQWGHKQIWAPEDGPYTLTAKYVFSTEKPAA